MKRENAVQDRVYGLAVIESIGDESKVARRGSRMEAKIGDCKNVKMEDVGDDKASIQSRVTLYLASVR